MAKTTSQIIAENKIKRAHAAAIAAARDEIHRQQMQQLNGQEIPAPAPVKDIAPEIPQIDTTVPSSNFSQGSSYLTGGSSGISSPYAASVQARQQARNQNQEQTPYQTPVPGNQQAPDDPYSAVTQAEYQAEMARRAAKDHQERQQQAADDQRIRDADLQEIESMSEAERAFLDQYIMERDQQFYNMLNPALSGSLVPSVNRNVNPLVEKYGQQRLNELAESLSRYRNEQLTEDVAQAAQDRAGQSGWAGAGHSMLTIPANLAGGITGILGMVKDVNQRTGRYSTLDANNVGNLLNTYAGAVRGEVAQNIAGDEYSEDGEQVKEGGAVRQGLSYAYQGVMSAADSIARALVGGEVGALGLAAAGSFAQTVSDASRQGATPQQAVILGIGSATLETLTEKIPLDEMFRAAKGGAKGVIPILKEVFRQAGIDATTEELSLVGNLMLEAAILKENSSYNQKIGELVANGASYAEAQEQVNREIFNEALQTAAVSAFAGGFSGGGSALVGSLRQNAAPEASASVEQEIAPEAVAEAPVAPVVEQEQQNAAPSMEQLLDGVQDMTPAPAPLTEEQQYFDNAAAIANGIEIKGTGAAEQNFSGKMAYNATLSEDNAQEDRRDDVRPMELPKQDINGGNISSVTGNAYGSKITPDEFASLMEEPTARGDFSYAKITNDQATQRATETIARAGTWESAYDSWKQSVTAGNAGAEMSARGALLLNHAAQQGNKQLWLETLHYLQKLGSNTAQGLQAFRIIRSLSAPDKVEFVKMTVQKLVEDLKLGIDIKVDENLLNAYEQAQTDEERDSILLDIQQNVADQIPSTALDKWTALRYMNMLGNLKTNVRNIMGNIGSALVYRMKDQIATTMERIAGTDRTKSHTVSQALLAVCKQDFEQFKNTVNSGGKYSENLSSNDQFRQGVMDKRRIYKNPLLEGYRKGTNWMMNNGIFGDEAFGRAAYARALAGYLKANGIKDTDLSKIDKDLMDKGRAYAIREAQEATFHDNSALAEIMSNVQRSTGIIGQAIMPFTKTPANVLTRAFEFSPLGIIDSTLKTLQREAGKSDRMTGKAGKIGEWSRAGSEITGADIVNSWAKTMTGTALFALGAAMMDQGLLSGGPDEDDEQAAFDKMNGRQNYAITLPDGTNYTIDWLTPAAMPMFMGAQFWDIITSDNDFTFADMEKVFTSIADPMIQMSMLQGLNDSLDSIKYSDNNLGQFFINAAVSYLSQGLTNTLLGQLERSTEENRQTTYIDKDSDIPQWMQQALGKASQKIPLWDFQQMEYRNAWGQTEENEGGLLYNMLSPGYISKEQQNAITEELNRLREVLPDENVFPNTVERTLTYIDKDGVRHTDYNLSMEELETMQRVQGETAANVINNLISSKDYAALTDEQKAEAIQMAYNYARQTGQIAALDNHLGYSESWMRGIKDREARTIIARTAEASLEGAMEDIQTSLQNGWDIGTSGDDLKWAYDTFTQLGKIAQDKVEDGLSGVAADYVEARRQGISHETFLNAAELLAGIEPQTGSNSPRDYQKAEAIADMDGISEDERTLLIRQQVSNSQGENLDEMLGLGYGPEEYAEILKIYRKIYDKDSTSTDKKNDFIKRIMDRYGLTSAEANAIYQIYK